MFSFEEGKLLLLGFGKSNRSLARYLEEKGLPFAVYDDAIPEKRRDVDLREFGAVVKTGGIRNDHFLVQKAKELNKKIVSDLEMFYAMTRKRRLITVTGTNGKTTTVKLIKHLLPELDLAGNVGEPLFDFAESEKDMVLEASSFMLEYTEDFRSQINVILNLSPNHMDHHGSFAAYAEAKLRLLKNAGPEDFLIYNGDDCVLQEILKPFNLRKIPFSRTNPDGIFISGSIIRLFGKTVDTGNLKLLGKHNQENVAAALGAVLCYDPNFTRFERLESFVSLPHRLEFVGKIGKTLVYNDSKATNYLALKTSLAAFSNKKVLLVAGGEKREEDPAPLEEVLGCVDAVLLNGGSGKELQRFFREKGKRTVLFPDLRSLLDEIKEYIKDQDVLLFSPGAVSHDQFKNFEERGDFFKERMKIFLTE
ncbi:MAG TPA: UDP-N-acetylmuramoyl-L-alanine--D-glutamate ligase [Acholeplasmataceae bacterium]|nr:UDP-N-acetylmuramoyl-L-alanine--D-glutamate ligase [Acholeplasmataceae bacterium]